MTIQRQNETARHDDIENLVEYRVINVSEEARKILGFKYGNNQPLIGCLDAHLEGHHAMCNREGNKQTAASRETPTTKIAEWIKWNRTIATARRLLHFQYPICFTKIRAWQKVEASHHNQGS